MSIKYLLCRKCSTEFRADLKYVCDECFNPLDVIYDFDKIRLSKDIIKNREKNLWRYFELLPLRNKNNIVDIGAGYTPLHKADKLAKKLGLNNLYIKNDTVNPSFSFKDRPAGVAVSKSIELGLEAVGAPSTGNLASATAAHAARAGIPCYIFIPHDIEQAKILQVQAYGANIIPINGTYDDANRLASYAGDKYNIGIVNINLRTYYVEGSKTLAFEVCEQLGWNAPDHVIVPTGSGAMLCAIDRGLKEFEKIDLITNNNTKITSAQPEGCSPIVDAIKNKTNVIQPVKKPNTLAKSLAIGEPGDGIFAVETVNNSGGYGENANDEEIRESIRLLASTEGIFAEPGGAISIAILLKLVRDGKIDANEKVVCYVTGNGLKAPEAAFIQQPELKVVEPKREVLEDIIGR
ncbi:MAG: threonine synthase [Nitrososphaerales archaeon]|jgi:threonine synthase|nr:threonine synthase [Nitrososphaerales archaeon]NSL75018.1 threonine synthase [Nitrososphaerota archaeon]HIM82938.1 threonine synthase [Nitrososphaerales archaeon]